jgi:hypothetical protein
MPRSETHDPTDSLAARYAEMADAELLDLRADFDDLTEPAQQALRQELLNRKLWSSILPPEELVPPPTREIESGENSADILLGGTSLCECESTGQANLICYALGREDITAAVYRPESEFSISSPQVRVAPDDVEKARAILAKGIPEEVVREFENLPTPEDFVEPPCPKCGAPDALLESVDPVNQWLCETCGTRWQDQPQAL